jgi:cbb3-type cytochrome oxidase subunit 1
MDWFAKAFIKTALLWLGLGVTLGVIMAVVPAASVYRTAHLHMNLLGFVSMMIYGVAYHVIPRFTGNAIHNRTIAAVQFWLANTGLTLLVTGLALRAHAAVNGRLALVLGGLAAGLAAYLFIYNLWRTLDGPVKPVSAAEGRDGSKHLHHAPLEMKA